jgi:hypothetical protein
VRNKMKKESKRDPDIYYGPGVKRPHVWICGPDPYKHQMYTPWQMAKAQANFRGEGWDMSFEEYYELWQEDWPNRGRGADDMCMTRLDPTGAWTRDNCHIMVRKEHIRETNALKTGWARGGRRKGQKDTKPRRLLNAKGN